MIFYAGMVTIPYDHNACLLKPSMFVRWRICFGRSETDRLIQLGNLLPSSGNKPTCSRFCVTKWNSHFFMRRQSVQRLFIGFTAVSTVWILVRMAFGAHHELTDRAKLYRSHTGYCILIESLKIYLHSCHQAVEIRKFKTLQALVFFQYSFCCFCCKTFLV